LKTERKNIKVAAIWLGKLLSLMASSSASAPIAFFDGFSSFAMLQRAPARATLYGTLGDGGTGATLTIAPFRRGGCCDRGRGRRELERDARLQLILTPLVATSR